MANGPEIYPYGKQPAAPLTIEVDPETGAITVVPTTAPRKQAQPPMPQVPLGPAQTFPYDPNTFQGNPQLSFEVDPGTGQMVPVASQRTVQGNVAQPPYAGVLSSGLNAGASPYENALMSSLGVGQAPYANTLPANLPVASPAYSNAAPAPMQGAPVMSAQGPVTDATGNMVTSPWSTLSNQLPPEVMPGPPNTPEERERRKSGWRAFMERVQNDPFLLSMLFRMGTELAQPIQPQQSAAGHIARAAQTGVDYAVTQREMRRRAELEGRKDVREEQALTSDLATAEQQRTIRGREEERAAASAPEQLRLLREQVSNATTENEIKRIEKDIKSFENQHKGEILQLEIDKTKEMIKYYTALANAANAKADPKKKQAAGLIQRLDREVQTLYAQEKARKPDTKRSVEDVRLEYFTNNPGLAKAYFEAHNTLGLETPFGVTAPEGAEAGEEVIDGEELLRRRRMQNQPQGSPSISTTPPRQTKVTPPAR